MVEADDAVVASTGLGFEFGEDAGVDPLVAASTLGGVRHGVVEDCFDVGPGRSGDEPDHDPTETDLVRDSRVVAAEGV
jgi:hypothetical protein